MAVLADLKQKLLVQNVALMEEIRELRDQHDALEIDRAEAASAREGQRSRLNTVVDAGKEAVKVADGSSILQLGHAMFKLQEVLEREP